VAVELPAGTIAATGTEPGDRVTLEPVALTSLPSGGRDELRPWGQVRCRRGTGEDLAELRTILIWPHGDSSR
jgi:hypothetical protein